MSEIKLKPCPFCGGEAHKRIAFPVDCDGLEMNMYIVGCETCDIQFSQLWDEEMAVKLWNTRKPIDDAEVVLKNISDDYKDRRDPYEQGKAFAYNNAIGIIRGGGITHDT